MMSNKKEEFNEFLCTTRGNSIGGVLVYFCERFFTMFGRRFYFAEGIQTGPEMVACEKLVRVSKGDTRKAKECIDYFFDYVVPSLPETAKYLERLSQFDEGEEQ